MLTPITPNEELAAATDHGELKFVLTMLSPTSGKEEDHDFVQRHGKHV